MYDILAGVPHGSNIAPLLYIIFTANIPTTNNTLIGTYTYDTTIFTATNNTAERI